MLGELQPFHICVLAVAGGVAWAVVMTLRSAWRGFRGRRQH